MIKVILADHQRVFRIGMASTLASEDDMRIVGQPQSISQLMHGLLSFRPHVLVMSSAFSVAIDAIMKTCEELKTAVLRLEDYAERVDPDLLIRTQGVMGRWADEATMIRCIRQLASGGKAHCLMRNPAVADESLAVGLRVRQRLTALELRITTFVVQGYTNREMANRLGTSEHTVKNSLRRIFDKTGVFDRLELALFVLHHGTLQPGAADANFAPELNSVADQRPLLPSRGRSTLN